MTQYKIFNGPMPTTGSQAPVATGTAIKTLLQLKGFNVFKVLEWGVSFDGSAAATPGKVELCETGTVFGTVTAFADADITKFDSNENAVASIMGLTLGTSASGYTCTSEGAITVVRQLDAQLVAPTSQYVYQFPQGREPKVIIGNALRIRVNFGASVNALAWVLIGF